MILGGEMTAIQKRIMEEVKKAIVKSSGDGGEINEACKDAITSPLGVYYYVYFKGNPPDKYNRRYNSGGLADKDNLFTTTMKTTNGAQIDIEDQTPVNGDGVVDADPYFYLSDLIESGGHGPKWPDGDWPGARPYLENSADFGCKRGGYVEKATIDTVNKANLSMI